MGHNFGGVNTVQILGLNDDLPRVGWGILLDVWLQQLLSPAAWSRGSPSRCSHSIGFEAFTHWHENYN